MFEGMLSKETHRVNNTTVTKKYFFLMTNTLSSVKVESLKRIVKALHQVLLSLDETHHGNFFCSRSSFS